MQMRLFSGRGARGGSVSHLRPLPTSSSPTCRQSRAARTVIGTKIAAMPLSWNEIRDRAHAFAREWKDAESERVAFLFELYQKYTSLLPGDSKPRRARKTQASA